MNATQVTLIKARHLDKPLIIFGDNVTHYKDGDKAAVILDNTNGIVHAIQTTVSPYKTKNDLVITSFGYEVIQYIKSDITIADLPTLLAGLVTAGTITQEVADDIITRMTFA